MCGIFLAVSTRHPIAPERFDTARDTLLHRGPDAAGTAILDDGRVALGHRRLAIIDLSASANQPMRLDTLHVTFNGEIYNYPKLKRELERQGCLFQTKSDTEVLLHGYRQWGEALCARLEGMFAFAIWDEAAGTLFIARDHLGQKPLYYLSTGAQFVAASEIKAIASYVSESFRLRPESIVDSLYYAFVPEPYTWYRDVWSLPPGHCLELSVRRGSLEPKVRDYWRFTPPGEPRNIDARTAKEEFGALFEATVQDHMLADVEVGAFLSGGVDSAGVTMIASRLSTGPIKTFSIGFGEKDDELERAGESARRFGSDHTTDIVRESVFRDSVEMALRLFDQPFSDTSLVPTDRVAALAAKRVKVVLTGDGGDEVFGGYHFGRHLSPWLDRRPRAGSTAKWLQLNTILWLKRFAYSALGEAWWHRHHDPLRETVLLGRLRSLLGPSIAAQIRDYDPSWAVEKFRVEGLDPFRAAQWSAIKLLLPCRMLPKVDRCTMAHSLESRAPILAPRLVEFLLSLPTDVKNPKQDWFKGLYRSYLRGKVPDSVVDAPKRGFGTPGSWRPIDSSRRDDAWAGLSRCLEADILSPRSLSRVSARPRTLWEFLQVERALTTNLMTV